MLMAFGRCFYHKWLHSKTAHHFQLQIYDCKLQNTLTIYIKTRNSDFLKSKTEYQMLLVPFWHNFTGWIGEGVFKAQNFYKVWNAITHPSLFQIGHRGADEDWQAWLAKCHAVCLSDLQVLWDLTGEEEEPGDPWKLEALQHFSVPSVSIHIHLPDRPNAATLTLLLLTVWHFLRTLAIMNLPFSVSFSAEALIQQQCNGETHHPVHFFKFKMSVDLLIQRQMKDYQIMVQNTIQALTVLTQLTED